METKIRKYLEGKASREDMLSLISWLENEENRAEFRRIKNDWKAKQEEQNVSLYTLGELDKFKSKILNERTLEVKKLHFIQNLYKYAALLLLMFIIGGGYLYFSGSGKYAVSYNTLIAENGEISKAVLPDKTVVWLNSGSSLKYSNQFGIRERNIELSGEAYFDVTKNKDLPLVVSCGNVNVRVLGTRFSAEAYPDSPEINVVLEKGAVELVSAGSNKAFAHLCPGEMMTYNKQVSKYEIKKVSAEKYTSWKDGVIHIYDQPLKDVAVKLQKRYNQQIIIDKELENYRVTFSIRNENFDSVLNMLQAITPARAYQEGEIIYMKKK